MFVYTLQFLIAQSEFICSHQRQLVMASQLAIVLVLNVLTTLGAATVDTPFTSSVSQEFRHIRPLLTEADLDDLANSYVAWHLTLDDPPTDGMRRLFILSWYHVSVCFT